MGTKNSEDTICYVIDMRKDIRSRIGKKPGDCVKFTVRERE